jgi:hypothetical protein
MSDNKPTVITGNDLEVQDKLRKIYDEFMSEDEYHSKSFWKHFENRKASKTMPVPDLSKAIELGVVYDSNNNLDVRMLLTLVHPEDKSLAIDIAKFVAERYVDKPATVLTIAQYRADLHRRMCQVGF